MTFSFEPGSWKKERAAQAMKITATDLAGFGVVDELVPEPPGGAHTDHETLFRTLQEVLHRQLEELGRQTPDQLVERRYQRFRNMGRLDREFVLRPEA